MLKDLPLENRPREKLLLRGPQALADNELLAILLRTGVRGKNVLQWASDVLVQFQGVAGLLHADAKVLQKVKGLGPAKRAELLAVLELSKRCLQGHLQERPLLNSAQTMRDFLQLQLGNKTHEEFAVAYLDTQHRLIAFETLFRGSLNQAAVYPREVAKMGLHYHASAVVLAHNHPSGNPEPSRSDIALTKRLRDALDLLDIRVLDHIIVTVSASVSLLERGLF